MSQTNKTNKTIKANPLKLMESKKQKDQTQLLNQIDSMQRAKPLNSVSQKRPLEQMDQSKPVSPASPARPASPLSQATPASPLSPANQSHRAEPRTQPLLKSIQVAPTQSPEEKTALRAPCNEWASLRASLGCASPKASARAAASRRTE